MNSNKQFQNIIKLFGMTNQLLIQDLNKIQAEFDIELGHTQNIATDKDQTYYPQFNKDIRIEASTMAQHYEIFYCLEKTIRSFISQMLEEAEGTKWWNSGRIPNNIHKEVSDRIKKEIDSATSRRSDFQIDYTSFGELGEIIKANWDVFGSVFNSQRAVEKVMGNLNTIRGPIAHCSSLAEDERIRLQLSVRDWFRLME